MSGYIKLHRSICENPMWMKEPFTYAQAWTDILLNANFKEAEVYIRNNKISLKRGQLAWSELTMCERWKWSRGKVRRFLKSLFESSMIVQETGHLTSVITVCNYDKYQDRDTTDGTADDTADGTTNGTQNKKVKKEKNKNTSCELFEKFWTETSKAWFGERGTKSEALKEFEKLSPDQAMTERLIRVAKSQGAHARRKQSDEGFAPNMKHACRWLKHGCWDVSDNEASPPDLGNVLTIPGCYRDANGNWRGYGT